MRRRCISLLSKTKISHCEAIYHPFPRNGYHVPQEYMMAAAFVIRLPKGITEYHRLTQPPCFLRGISQTPIIDISASSDEEAVRRTEGEMILLNSKTLCSLAFSLPPSFAWQNPPPSSEGGNNHRCFSMQNSLNSVYAAALNSGIK